MLIRNAHETEEALEQMRSHSHAMRAQIDAEATALREQVAQLERELASRTAACDSLQVCYVHRTAFLRDESLQHTDRECPYSLIKHSNKCL